MRVTFVTSVRVCTCMAFAISSERRSVCVALIAIAGRRYTYTVYYVSWVRKHWPQPQKRQLLRRARARGRRRAAREEERDKPSCSAACMQHRMVEDGGVLHGLTGRHVAQPVVKAWRARVEERGPRGVGGAGRGAEQQSSRLNLPPLTTESPRHTTVLSNIMSLLCGMRIGCRVQF